MRGVLVSKRGFEASRIFFALAAMFCGSVAAFGQRDVIQFSSRNYEVLENSGSVTIQLVRTGPMTDYASVQLRTELHPWGLGPPAVADTNDFPLFSRRVEFAPGQSNLAFRIDIFNDARLEPDEVFDVLISDPDPFCCELGTNTRALVTIHDNDLGVQFGAAAYSVFENAAEWRIQVSRLGDPTNQFSVDLQFAGTATVGADFIWPTNRVFFPPGESNAITLVIPVLDDPIVEDREYIYLYLTNPTAGVPLGSQGFCKLTLEDNERPSPVGDSSLWFSASQLAVLEGGTSAYVTILRGGNSGSAISVDFTTTGDAMPGLDFLPASGTVTFDSLETIKSIVLQILDDCQVETNGTVQITLTNASAGVFVAQPDRATLQILDDDSPGSLDELNPFIPAQAAALQPDGKIVIGGRTAIARLNKNGLPDSSFPLRESVCGIFSFPLETVTCGVFSIVIQLDGKILVAGIGSVIRLDAQGGAETIASATDCCGRHGESYPAIISSLLLQPDGKIIVQGEFNRVQSLQQPLQDYPCFGLVRLHPSGAVDEQFLANVSTNGSLNRPAVLQPDGKLVLAGEKEVLRLNSDGTVDTSFAPFFAGAEASIYALALLPDQKILVGGELAEDDRPIALLRLLHPDGSLETNFNPAITIEGFALKSAEALTIARDGPIILAGYLSDGSMRVVKLNLDGSRITTFNSSLRFLGGRISAILEQPDGELLVAGGFDRVNAMPRAGLARLLSDRSHIRLALPTPGLNGSLRMVTGSQTDKTYILQKSADLTAWTSVSTNTAVDCTLELIDPSPSPENGFYRVIKID
jgi:uncharacterized delta-60 repeat protein